MRITLGAAIGTLALALLGAGCGGNDDSGNDDSGGKGGTIQLGATVERTGPVPVLGKAQDGMEAAVDHLNASGGIDGNDVELVVRDNAGDPSKAISNIEEFADRGINVVVGPVFGSNCDAIAPVVAEADLVDFCISTTPLPEEDAHMFGVGVGYEPTTAADFDFLATLGDRVGMQAAKNKSGDDSLRLAEEEADRVGVEVLPERVEETDTTFKPQLQRLIEDDMDVLYLTSCGPITITAAQEAISLGFEGKILIENCFASAESAQALKGFANDQIVMHAPQFMLGDPDDGDSRSEAINTYDEVIGEQDIVVAAGWDSVMMAAAAIEEAGTTETDELVATLEDDFEYVGPWHAGTITAEDHRGAVVEGALVPAYFTSNGKIASFE